MKHVDDIRSTPHPLRVFIAEDSALMLPRLIELTLSARSVVCGTAADVRGMLTGIDAESPDAVIADIHLADGSSLPALKELSRRHPAMVSIVCSNSATDPFREAARDCGARHFIDKSLEADRIPGLLADIAAVATTAATPPSPTRTTP